MGEGGITMKHLFCFTFLTFVTFLPSLLNSASLPNNGSKTTSPTISANHHSLVHLLNERIHKQRLLIQKGFKAGALSKEQAESIWASLKAARLQETTFFKQNHNHQLTPEQQNQLNSALNKNSQILGESPTSN